MTIQLLIQPPFRDEWTAVTIQGEHEDEVSNVLTARLTSAEFEILIEDSEGEMIPFEEFDHG